jgi:serine/threonine-protein kinase
LKLARPLGRGGMGTVWVAEHAALGREVAVKFLSEELAHDPLAVARFEREASAVAELKNAHIVDVIEFGFTESGLPYMATELLEGEDLGDRLMRDRRIAPEVFAAILDQVCDALASAHELGIVHRDIKPENVFVVRGDGSSNAQPSIRLLDFGIAKHWQDPKLDVTSTGVVVGTPHYMSPEQFLSAKHVDFRADLWSLGVLAYRAVTGRLPFEATSFAALCIQIHRGVFPRASAYRADLPPSLDAWFTKALRGHPAARFSSAREMAATFEAALSGSLSQGSPSDWRHATPPKDLTRRHIAAAKLARDPPSIDSDEVTIDLAGLFPGDHPPRAEITITHQASPRRMPITFAALAAIALSIAAVSAFRPSESREPAVLAIRPTTPEPVKIEPSEPPLPAPAVAASSAPEPRPLVVVPGKSNTLPPTPKKVSATPSPPKEPDRGF